MPWRRGSRGLCSRLDGEALLDLPGGAIDLAGPELRPVRQRIGDRLQELLPPAVGDRTGEREQEVHLFVGKTQRLGHRGLCFRAGAATMTPRACDFKRAPHLLRFSTSPSAYWRKRSVAGRIGIVAAGRRRRVRVGIGVIIGARGRRSDRRRAEADRRTLGRVREVIDFAREHDDVRVNPATWSGWLKTKLGDPSPTKRDRRTGERIHRDNHAAMRWQDVPKLVARLEKDGDTSALALTFAILTGLRASEARKAR